ncbi:MAG: PH domain-containing protein [Candidatus Saccharimonadales bacterium]
MSTQQKDYSQPVAYDKDGNPLYAHPPVEQSVPATAPPQVVQVIRAVDPQQPHISDESRRRHDESRRQYPTLNLSEGEYVINAIRRHPIGLVGIYAVTAMLITLTLGGLMLYPSFVASSTALLPSVTTLIMPVLLFILLIAIGGYIAAYVYQNNRFFLTNESVIQEIQVSLFSHNEQTVSLGNIEDASYRRQGIMQSLFNYGSIRLSTEGDETTYRFQFVEDPKKQIAILNNAVESFKHGRPVQGE